MSIAIDNPTYTTQLQAGLGLVDETKTLLDLWSPGMSVNQLHHRTLNSGRFSGVSARRLRNIIAECFAPRYLTSGGAPAAYLKQMSSVHSNTEMTLLMLIFTSRANRILGDFIRQIYWVRYAGGYSHITNKDAREFVERGIDDGKTTKRWSETTVRRVSAYLTGCCADYGMLERGMLSNRRILSFRILPSTVAYLAHELHFAGVGDKAILTHEDWRLFGLEPEDVLYEIKQLSLKGLLVVQSAGDVTRISWKFMSMEELCDALTKS